MSNLDRYPDDYPEWKDHTDSPEAKRLVPDPVKLSAREEEIARISYERGYEQGKFNQMKGYRISVNYAVSDFIETSKTNGTWDELI